MPNSTPSLYVKNPNYSPFDTQSNRYVTDAQAQQEAAKRARTMNDFFSPFAGVSKLKTYDPSAFYTPLATPQIVPSIQMPATKPTAPVVQGGTQTQPTAPVGVRTVPVATGTPVPAPGVTPVPQQQVPTDAASIAAFAEQAGKAGMGTADFLKLLEQRATPTAQQTQDIRTKLGIPNLVDEAFKKPDKTMLDTYKEMYDMSNLGDIRTKVSALDERIAQKRADLVRATGDISNNPWISQATRQGRLKNLQELAYADIQNDIDAKDGYLQLYDQGVSEIENRLNIAQSDRTDARSLTVDHLNYLLNEAERQTGALQQDTITGGLRSVPEFLSGVLSREATQYQRDLGKVIANKTGSTGGTGVGTRNTGGAVSPRAQAVLDAPELLANYTPTERGKILDELTNAGHDVSSVVAPKLGSANREQIAQYDDLVRQGKEAETILAELGINTGPIASRVQKAGAVLGFAKDFTTYRSVIDNMGSTLLKLRSGAAVTPQEFERLRGFIPQVGEDESTALTKIQKFYAELETARQNYVMRQTQTTNQIKQSVGLGGSTALGDFLSGQGL